MFTLIVTYISAIAAKMALRRRRPLIIGINGSVGKTGTKAAAEAVFKLVGKKVARGSGHFNTELGVSLAVIGVSQYVNTWQRVLSWLRHMLRSVVHGVSGDVLFVELGIDRTGDAERLLSIVQPDIAVITSVAPAHVAGYEGDTSDPLEIIIKETIAHAERASKIVVSADDREAIHAVSSFRGQRITYGLAEHSDVRVVSRSALRNADGLLTGQTVVVTVSGRTYTVQQVGVYGIAHAYYIAASLAVLVAADIPSSLWGVVERMAPVWPHGRMCVLPNAYNAYLVDDSYNASPVAMHAFLDAVEEVASEEPSAKHVVVLGSMNELGNMSEAYHREVGERVRVLAGAHKNISFWSVGKQARFYGDDTLFRWFPAVQDAIDVAPQLLHMGDRVWLKGSQNGVRLEKLAAVVLSNTVDASSVLCRQGSEWE